MITEKTQFPKVLLTITIIEVNNNDFIYVLGSKAKCSANRGVPTDKIKTNIVKPNVAFEEREKQVFQEKNLS